ncbi:MAG TPA: hypothetical protein VHE54_09415 [Puia sp.]|nr:hypothetical protein [Puia sp.]
MQRNLRSLFASGDLDAVPVAIAGFFIIQALCAYGGIGVSPDSIVYISTAQHIHDQAAINDFTDMPLMDFPAFYPIFLAGIQFLTGRGVMAFGPALNGLLFALLILLCGRMMNRFLHRSRGYTVILLVIIAVSPCLLEIYSMIWSETLFLVLSLVFMIGCYHYFRTHSMGWLIFIGTIAGLACVTRYAGVSLAGMGGFLMLCDRGLRWGRRKLGHITLYSLLSILLLTLNLYRNWRVTGTLTGYREPGVTPFGLNVHDFGSVICDWLPFLSDTYQAATAVAVFFILFITGIFLYRLVRKTGFFSYDTIALSYFVVYTAFILFTATVSRFQQLDSRLLSPLFLPWLWGSTCWIPGALRRNPPRRRLAGLLLSVAAAVFFLAGEGQTFQENWSGIHDAGIPGYTENTWRRSETMAFVREHRDSLENIPRMGTLYSDAFEGLWFLAGVRSDLLPHKDNTEDIRYMLKADRFTVVWFDDAVNTDLISIDFIKARKPLVRETHFSDGAIYYFQDSTAAPPNQ